MDTDKKPFNPATAETEAKARNEAAAAKAEADAAAPVDEKFFDVSNVEQQIDVIREYLRRLYAQGGPTPDILMPDHDMGYAARQASAGKPKAAPAREVPDDKKSGPKE